MNLPHLRPATVADVEDIALVWHRGWQDGHLGKISPEIIAHRTPESFRARVPQRLELTTVAILEERVAGFVTVVENEVEQLYVSAAARGSGIASRLLDHAERTISRRFASAWLAVVEGNARARRFYARQGWRDEGPLLYSAEIEGGSFQVPTRRYVKDLETT